MDAHRESGSVRSTLFRAARWAGVVALAIAGVALTMGWWSPAGFPGGVLGPVAGLAGAAVCGFAAVRGPRSARTSWAMFALVLALYAGGDSLWLIFGGAAGTPPILSIADALYLAALLPAIAGVTLYPAARSRRGTTWPLVFDAAVLGAAALLASYVLVFDEVVRRSDSRLDVFLLLVYPVTDVLLTCLVVLLMLRSVGDPRPDLVLIGLFFATYVFADNGYALLTVRGQDSLYTVVDLAYVVAPLVLCVAAYRSATRPPGHGSFSAISAAWPRRCCPTWVRCSPWVCW